MCHSAFICHECLHHVTYCSSCSVYSCHIVHCQVCFFFQQTHMKQSNCWRKWTSILWLGFWSCTCESYQKLFLQMSFIQSFLMHSIAQVVMRQPARGVPCCISVSVCYHNRIRILSTISWLILSGKTITNEGTQYSLTNTDIWGRELLLLCTCMVT